MKLIIPISAKLNVQSPNETPMKLKNYKKQPTSIFALYYLLLFLDTQMHEPKISEKTISEFFDDVLVFPAEILNIQRSSVHKRHGVDTTNLGSMEARCLMLALSKFISRKN